MLRRISKWFLYLSGALVVILSAVAALVFFAPDLVSTKWFKEQFEQRASSALNRSVTVKDIRWTWKQGMNISGLEVAGDPQTEEPPLLSLGSMHIAFDLKPFRKHLFLNLDLEELTLHLIRYKNGNTNLQKWLDRSKTKPESRGPERSKSGEEKPFLVLPGNLTARINLKNGAVHVNDHMENHRLVIHDIAFGLDVPSLRDKPLTLAFQSRQEMDGAALPPIDLTAHVDGLINEKGAVAYESAKVQTSLSLPGLRFQANGAMAEKGLTSKAEVDLAVMAKAAGPFMPSGLPRMSGHLKLDLKARLTSPDQPAFEVDLEGTALKVSRGPLKEKQLGPLSFRLTQAGNFKTKSQTLTLSRGSLHLMEKCHVSWHGLLKPLKPSGMDVNVSLNDIGLNLAEIEKAASDLMPSGLSLFGTENPHESDFSIHGIRITGKLPKGETTIVLENMGVNLSRLNLSAGERKVRGENLAFKIENISAQLKDLFPQNLALRLSGGFQDATVSGKPSLSLAACRLNDAQLIIQHLNRSDASLWGISGEISLRESGEFEGLQLADRGKASRLTYHLQTNVILPMKARAEVTSAQVSLSTGELTLAALSNQTLKNGLNIKLNLSNAVMTDPASPVVDLDNLEMQVRAGDLLDLQFNGSATASGSKGFESNGTLSLDLDQILPLLPSAVRKKGAFTGHTALAWRVSGRRPAPLELQKLKDATLPYEKRLEQLSFLKELDLEVQLDKMGLNASSKLGKALDVQGIRSEKPLKITLKNGLNAAQMSGEIHLDRIMELPSLGKLSPPLSARLSVDATSHDVNSMKFSETLKLSPLEVEQQLELNLNKLKRLLKKSQKPDLKTVLKTLEADLKAGLMVNMGTGTAPFTKGMVIKGPLKGHLDLTLEGGKNISADLRLDSEGLDITMAPEIRVQDFSTHVLLNKSYRLAFAPLKANGSTLPPALSRQVLENRHVKRHDEGITPFLSQRLVDDLRGRLAQKPTISFQSAHLLTGPFPVTIQNLLVQMRLQQSLPAVDYFQMDIMGGTLLGDVRVFKADSLYFLDMTGTFSNLDADRLVPVVKTASSLNSKEDKADSSLSGRMQFRIPLNSNAQVLMNHLEGAFRLTHIGSRTLERFLYALDPHENNETIVKQRALLRKGTPRWIELRIRQGNLSLSGEVSAGGTRISLPSIRRLNIAGLPIQKRIEKLAIRLVPLVRGLRVLSANTLHIGPEGTIDFTEETK